jgi:non-ribosomal peptide synthase protein (TIGR01720 family)
MDDLTSRIANLSAAKRALLEQRLAGKAPLPPGKAAIPGRGHQVHPPLAFRIGGAGTPLFLFHYLTSSQVLAKHIGPGRPIFAVNSPFDDELAHWEKSGELSVTLEELAERSIAELRLAQPRGPYCLAGFCFGGVVAFEVASLLAAQGEQIAFLGLLDSFYIPGIDPSTIPWLMSTDTDDMRSDDTEAERTRWRHVVFMREIVKRHRADPYHGDAVLFRAMSGREQNDPTISGWQDVLVGGLRIEDCACARADLFEEPFVRNLSARLTNEIDQADAKLHAPGKAIAPAAPASDPSQSPSDKPFIAPRTEIEKALAGIWSQVLRVPRVGLLDKFFELGGDSILSIQVISKARQAGLRLTLKQIFQYQTIAELAAIAEQIAMQGVQQGDVSGEVPLTPIQKWFFEQNFINADHWNQARLLELKQDIDPLIIEKALSELVHYHDALRLRFVHENGSWRQFNSDAGEKVKLERLTISAAGDFEPAAAAVQSSLNLSDGPLLRAALFDFGAGKLKKLLIAIHHLAVDGVSWRILLDDLRLLLKGASLPPKTTSYKTWSEQLLDRANSPEFAKEADYWLRVSSDEPGSIPLDVADGQNTESSASTITLALDADETRTLLQDVPRAYNTQINDVLLSALALALTHWSGRSDVLIDLEGHGREDIIDGVDLSRTVGWFTGLFPVRLDRRGLSGPGEVLKSIKEQLRRIPRRGIGYGMLRYLSTDQELVGRLRSQPAPQVVFNYLGQFEQSAPASSFAVSDDSVGPVHDSRASRGHLLEINSMVLGDCLSMDWRFSQSVHRRGTIERVARVFLDELRSLIQHCASPAAGGYTPSDFADAGLDQKKLDRLISKIR